MDMKIKIFEGGKESVEIIYNQFTEDNDVKATQSHINIVGDANSGFKTLTTLVAYYNEKPRTQPQNMESDL